MRIKINFDTGIKVHIDLQNPVKILVKSKDKTKSFVNPKEAILYSSSLTQLGIDNSIKLLFS